MKRSALALLLLAAGCADHMPREAAFPAGDATASVSLAATQLGQLEPVRDSTRRIMLAVWKELHAADGAGELAKINRMAGSYRLQVSHSTFRLLDLAHYYGQLTGNAFDLTVAPLLEAWGFGDIPPDGEPSGEILSAILDLVGPHHVQFSEQGAVSILTPGTQLAAGPLVYAYGVDLAVLDARNREIPNLLVRWKDSARAEGNPTPETGWRVPVRDPFANAPLGEVDLSPRAALAIVGLYDRTITLGNRRYGGIMDPRTGRPAEGAALVAVRGPTCTMAHALAQALVVLGPEEGVEIMRAFPDCEALLVPDRRPLECWMTPGWAEHFTLNPAHAAAARVWTVEREPAE
ncbi:MAG TPA: FAD:protein FMN transferase [Kiritimatiellia bacterium]|nr:FAD:protein FMN transferase [Kiritimatiellia bacterium]